jgi:hypothetical protein
MPSIFPLEIEEIILDILAEDDKDHSALKICSLVCQAFLHICRKHIFGSIVLNRVNSPTTTHAFERLLRKTPEIANYIRKLDCNIDIEDLTSPSIQESLKRITRLEFLKVEPRFTPRLDWSNNPIRPALLHLLYLPTLAHFEMNHFKGFTVSDLIPCVNLKCLDIRYMSMAAENTFPSTLPEHSIQLKEFVAGFGISAADILKLYSARCLDGQPIIDFRSLHKITVVFDNPDKISVFQELFRHCRVFTKVRIYCK